MFEAFKVGVELSLSDQVSRGLEYISKHLLSTVKDAEKLEAKLANIKQIAMAGGIAVGLGSEMLSGLKDTVDHSMDYSNQLSKLKALGLTQQQIATATGAAWATSHQVMTASAGDSLKVFSDLQGGLHGLPVSVDAIGKALPVVQQVQAVMAKLTGRNQDEIGKEMMADVLKRTHGKLDDARLIQQLTNVGNDMVGKAMGGKGGSADATKIYQDMVKQDPEMAEQALQAQWHNVQMQIGLDILPKLLPLMRDFASGLDSLSGWMSQHKTLVTNLALSFGVLAGALALGGMVATMTSAVRGFGLVFSLFSGPKGAITAAADVVKAAGGRFGKLGELAKLAGGRLGSFGTVLEKTVEGVGSKFGNIGKLVESFGGKLGGFGKTVASEAATAENAAAKTAVLAGGLGEAEGGGLIASLGMSALALTGWVAALGAVAFVAYKAADHFSQYNLTPHEQEDERIKNAIHSATGSTWHDAIGGKDYQLVYRTSRGAHGGLLRTVDEAATLAAYHRDHPYDDQRPPVTVKTPAQQTAPDAGDGPLLVRVVNINDMGRGCLNLLNTAGSSPYGGASTADHSMSGLVPQGG